MAIEARLHASLREAGMRDVPERFTVARAHQELPLECLRGIDALIRAFDRVTTRRAWQEAVTRSAPAIAHRERHETCFFSAWDFHVPPGRTDGPQLIELNDNGSGFLFAALVNARYYELGGLGASPTVRAPEAYGAFADRVVRMLRSEVEAFHAGPPRGLTLVLDDAESVHRGRFRDELVLLRDLCRGAGLSSEIAVPEDLSWDAPRLLCRGEPVASVVNRSTDFYWEDAAFGALRAAYDHGSVYVAPNPFTYATRSSKHLLELLSSPERDAELGIEREERAILGAHIPETRVLRPENLDELLRQKDDLFFKPSHGFASHGLLTGREVGGARLRRLLRKSEPYVVQRRVPKSRLETEDGAALWIDVRVWAHRGDRFLVSGRASRDPDRLDLSPPGGWLPTYACA